MKKICYVPEMICLLMLLVLIVVFVNSSRKSTVYRDLEVIMINKEKMIQYYEEFKKENPSIPVQAFPAKRTFEDINITGIPGDDEVKLAYSQIRIREMLQQKNIEIAIRYKFGDGAKFGAFVKALDIINIEKVTHYLVESDNIAVYYIPPDTTRYETVPMLSL